MPSEFRLVSLLVAPLIVAGCSVLAEDVESGESAVEVEGELAAHYTGLWTNWWRDELNLQEKKAQGIAKLVKIREVLTRDNLHDTYAPGAARLGKIPECTGEARTRRTLDGTCNDLGRPTAGAANTRFGRNIDPKVLVPEDEETMLRSPSPREVSVKLLARDRDGERRPVVKEVDFLNLTAASWIQFQTHDWFAHAQQSADLYKVSYGNTTLFIPKSVDEPRVDLPGLGRLKVFRNENTPWWDGSQLYGSDDATALRLRTGPGGTLAPRGALWLENDQLLPVRDGREDSGFTKNWWVGLSMLHTLFAKEHNAIAKEIGAAHPELSDDQVFHVARMVNAAVMAKIHTVEWTPAILKNPGLRVAMNINWNGINAPGFERPPILGNAPHASLVEVPYSLTEEFTAVYRLHSLLPETLSLQHAASPGTEAKDLAQTRYGRLDVPAYSMADLFYSFGQQHPGQLTLHNFPRFLQELVHEKDLPLVGSVELARIDMASVDILRDRERGVPRYNEFRRRLKLLPITKFEDLFLYPADGTAAGEAVSGPLPEEHQRFVRELRDVYGKDKNGDPLPEERAVERLDLLVGCLAESVRPTGFGFGETAFQVFILMASRRLQADRFFTTSYDAATYTQEGLDWVKRATMKEVLLRHYRNELAATLEGVDNAFFPWTPTRRP